MKFKKLQSILLTLLVIPVITIAQTLEITPLDTTIQVGNLIQFKAQFTDTNSVIQDTSAAWFVKNDLVGPISEDGLLFTFFPGQANIMAELDTITAIASLSVVDTTSDSTGINKVKIVRIFPNGKEKNPKTINEGEKYVIGGIPHPFNIINGGAVYFPMGSLHEDITLEIKIPKIAKIKGDSVEFINEIVNGIQFDVFVNDSLIKPYNFDKPVSVAIPFKRGILKRFGIDVNNLGLFFAEDSVTFDSLGISHVMVDSSENRIFGLVEHFSSLVVHENKDATSIEPDIESVTLKSFVLKQNYPNPFNPETIINYELLITNDVQLTVYNALGQKLRTLVNRRQEAGTHKATFNADGFASGIYFYRLSAGSYTQIRKMILIR